jgi:hypothetical protein
MLQEITLSLPKTVYKRIQNAAKKTRRPIKDVLVEAVTAVAPFMEASPGKIHPEMAQMAYLNDAALWQAARATMNKKQRKRLEALHFQQQSEGLTKEEKIEEQELLKLYHETILVRAQAAVLLKQRGYDVSDLGQFAPLE